MVNGFFKKKNSSRCHSSKIQSLIGSINFEKRDIVKYYTNSQITVIIQKLANALVLMFSL